MTVKELIAKLQTMPPDMEVFAYSEIDEGDTIIDTVAVCHKDKKDEYSMKEYYCQGYSVAAVHLRKHGNQNGVVVLGTGINC